ncbi:hypothetical protein QFC22_004956 [Naganishia vaughanmartiniae]|uniref:Uncharacterized protein n=1 Tax=Naganishia vaughanmartiniae TaxID=1424756 RepID=A0ACC2WXE1_9TREE|nr:hypothetical protein QFC22_004956 [Naganishia vaughanmartiniae]
MSVPMPNWHQSEISAAGGDAINSTSAFDHATHLEAQAYQANRWLFIAMMIVLGWCIFAQLPHTIIRMRWASGIWNGFRLGPPGPAGIVDSKDKVVGPSGNIVGLDKTYPQATPPRRLAHLHLSLPIYTVPFLDLPLPQFLVVVFALALGLGVAGWCQASFLTHASRSTLVVMAIMSLTAGFGVKAFGVGTWLQVGYTAVNFLHRWLGRLVLLLATLHVIAYLVVFYRAGVAKEQMALPANYLGAVAYGGLLLTGLASIRPIRRRWWWVFKFGHHFGLLLVLAGLNYHSGDIIPYLIAIWGLILINIIFRTITTRYTVATLQALPGAESTLIIIPALTRGFVPGQHVRIRMWSLLTTRNRGMKWRDAMESHPFTISTPSDAGEGVTLVTKSAGDWTRAVYDLAVRDPAGVQVRCSIEGPYGGPLNFLFPAFASVIVVVGGSGRNIEALEPQLRRLIDLATSLEASGLDVHLSLILCFTSKTEKTGGEGEKGNALRGSGVNNIESPLLSVKIVNSRPDLQGILEGVVKLTLKGGVGVGVCGPSGLVQSVEKYVRDVPKDEKKRVQGVELYAEAFSL